MSAFYRMQQPPAGSVGEALVEKLSVAIRGARNVVAEEENFERLALFLERLCPIATNLCEYEDKAVEEVIEALLRNIQSAQELITLYTSKSRIYLLTHCRLFCKQLADITHTIGGNLLLLPDPLIHNDVKLLINVLAQELQEAEYQVKESHERICRSLEQDDGSTRTDLAVQRGILMDIARSVGVDDLSRNPAGLKNEIDLSKSDAQETKEPYDLHMMDVIGNIYNNYVHSNGQPSPSDDLGAFPNHREYRRLEHLYEAFVCPLTKQVMRDPVTLESGQTYERVAIERWFQECRDNGRETVCPITGQLVTAPPKPSIALRNTIEEWTSRNEQARIDIARILITGEASESDVLYGLKDVQALCRKNRLNKYKVRNAGLIPQIVDRLKNGDEARVRALVTLRVLADDDVDNKVRLQ